MPPQTPHLVAGKEAMSAMAKLLGLTLARDAWRLEALCGLGEENVRLGLRHLGPVAGGLCLCRGETGGGGRVTGARQVQFLRRK